MHGGKDRLYRKTDYDCMVVRCLMFFVVVVFFFTNRLVSAPVNRVRHTALDSFTILMS